MTQTDLPPFTRIVGAARSLSGLTAAQFDYSLQSDGADSRAAQALHNVIYAAATRELRAVTEGDDEAVAARWDAAKAAREHYTTDIVTMIDDARRKSYTGWSRANSGPIRYATQA